jgi:hypothetical protein
VPCSCAGCVLFRENGGVDAWLQEARDAVAAVSGLPPAELELDEDQIRTVLEIASFAAHESGERTNAPLLCYLAGIAVRGGSVDLETLAQAVERAP